MGVLARFFASTSGIVGLLSKAYALLVLPANGIAWPVTFLVMQRWLIRNLDDYL